MIVLDACVLISHFGPGDAHQTKAANIIDSEDQLLIHPLTISECGVMPARTGQLDEYRSDIDRLGLDVWRPDDDHWYRVAALRAATSLALPDCCVLDTARTLVGSLATFDDKLTKVAKSMGIPVDDGHAPRE